MQLHCNIAQIEMCHMLKNISYKDLEYSHLDLLGGNNDGGQEDEQEGGRGSGGMRKCTRGHTSLGHPTFFNFMYICHTRDVCVLWMIFGKVPKGGGVIPNNYIFLSKKEIMVWNLRSKK